MTKTHCERCGSKHKISRHHILPKRWHFEHKLSRDKRFVFLCGHCHRVIEKILQRMEKQGGRKRRQLPRLHYINLARYFINDPRLKKEVCCYRCEYNPCPE